MIDNKPKRTWRDPYTKAFAVVGTALFGLGLIIGIGLLAMIGGFMMLLALTGHQPRTATQRPDTTIDREADSEI